MSSSKTVAAGNLDSADSYESAIDWRSFVESVQEALRVDRLDGWLLYDFRGINRIAADIAGISADDVQYAGGVLRVGGRALEDEGFRVVQV